MISKVFRYRVRGRAPGGRWITEHLATCYECVGPTEANYCFSKSRGPRIELAFKGDVVDLATYGERFYVKTGGGWISCVDLEGRIVWEHHVGNLDVKLASAIDRPERIWIAGGLAWTVLYRDYEPSFVGYDALTGELLATSPFPRMPPPRGVVEIEDGLVVELDDRLVVLSRSGTTVLAETLNPGRTLFTNGCYAVGLDGSGSTMWVVSPGARLSWWKLPPPATGVVVEDHQIRIDTARGSFAFPPEAFERHEPLCGPAGDVVLEPSTPPALREAAETMVRAIASTGVLGELTDEEIRDGVDEMEHCDLWTALVVLGRKDGDTHRGMLFISREDFLITSFNEALEAEGFQLEELEDEATDDSQYVRVDEEPDPDAEESDAVEIENDLGQRFEELAAFVDEQLERRGRVRRVYWVEKPVDYQGKVDEYREYGGSEHDAFLMIEPAQAAALIAAGCALSPMRTPIVATSTVREVTRDYGLVDLYRAEDADAAIAVRAIGKGTLIGYFQGFGGQNSGFVWARLAQYSMQLLAEGYAVPAPEPAPSGAQGDTAEGELLVRAWLDRRALPIDPKERVLAVATRIGAVCDRINERWYGAVGTGGASGAIVWVEADHAALMIRGDTRVYHRGEGGPRVVIREHVMGAIAPDIPASHAHIGISYFTLHEGPLPPPPIELALGRKDRLAFVTGKILQSDLVETLVMAHSLEVAANELAHLPGLDTRWSAMTYSSPSDVARHWPPRT